MSDRIPEDKTQRLASLNQDVFSVPAGGAPQTRPSKPRAEKAPGRAAPAPARPSSAPEPLAHPTGTSHNALMIGIMVLALLLVGGIGGGVVFGFSLWERVSLIETENAALSTSIVRMEQRIASLEGQLSAAQEETSDMGDDEQASILQFSSRLRKVALDVTRATADLAKIEKKLGAVDSTASGASAKVDDQARRLAALASQVAGMPAQTAAPAPAGPTEDAKAREDIQAIQSRLDRMSNEIRAIYRLLEQAR